MIRRLVTAAFALLGAAAAPAAPPRSVSPEAAPAEWVRYAEDTTAAITGWLEADDAAAVRLRTYLDATRPAPDQPTPPLALKFWIERDGSIARIDFPPFAHLEPNADLRGLIVGRKLASPPPRDMLLPIRLAIQLSAPTEPQPEAAAPVQP